MKFSEKFISNQYENRKYFRDDDSFDKELYSAIIKANNMEAFESEYSIEVHKSFSMDDMSVSPVNFALFETLIRLKPYKKILEIGTFLGGTSLRFSHVVGKNGKITTIEKFDEFAQIAKRNFIKNCQFDNIELIVGDAMKVLNDIKNKNKFDFVFIDGNKEHYYDYLIKVDQMLIPGGMIIIDDIFFNGDSLNSNPLTEKGAGVKKVLENLSDFANYRITTLPIGNGCLIMTHKG